MVFVYVIRDVIFDSLSRKEEELKTVTSCCNIDFIYMFEI